MKTRFENQTGEELTKVFKVECTVGSNGWEKFSRVTIGKETFKLKEGDEIPIELEEEIINPPAGPSIEETLNGIEKGLEEETLTIEDLSDSDKTLWDEAAPYKAKTVKELKADCKERGLSKYSALKENALVEMLINDDKKGAN